MSVSVRVRFYEMICKPTREKILSLYIKTAQNVPPSLPGAILAPSFFSNTLKKSMKDDSNDDNDADAVRSSKHCIFVPEGMSCIPRYPVDYVYACGLLILHKPWSNDNTLTRILKDHQKTINTFLTMIDKKEIHSSVALLFCVLGHICVSLLGDCTKIQ
jgi:hypothetical protein